MKKESTNLDEANNKKWQNMFTLNFENEVKTALQGESNGFARCQLKEKGKISQAHMCYTSTKKLESDIGVSSRVAQ